ALGQQTLGAQPAATIAAVAEHAQHGKAAGDLAEGDDAEGHGARTVGFVQQHQPPSTSGYWTETGKARQSIVLIGVPYEIRTRVTAVKGRCPGPLDERDKAGAPTATVGPAVG